jgi:hypothetical protein
VNSPNLFLGTYGTPANGGVYTGGAPVFSNYFHPGIAGIGTHTVTYTRTASTTGCTNSATQTITVTAPPTVTFATAGDACVDDTAFSISGGFPIGGSYSGNYLSGTTFNPSQSGTGQHPITYTYTDPVSGCFNSAVGNVVVHALPNVNFTGVQPLCEDGNSITLTGVPAGGTFFGSGMIGNTFYPGVSHAGVHAVTYTFTDQYGCTNQKVKDITVYADPVVYLGADTTICWTHTLTLSANPGMDTYLWSTGHPHPNLTLDSNDFQLGFNSYNVTVWKNGCDAMDTINVYVDPCTGIGDIVTNDFMQIYPNPNNGQFNMVVFGEADDMNLAIYNELGQVILTDQFHIDGINAYERSFDMSTFPTGVYFVKVQGMKSLKVKKVVVQ